MYWCDGCNHSARAPLPARVEAGGLLGPHLTTLVAYLKGVCHASYSTARLFLRDVVGLKWTPLSRPKKADPGSGFVPGTSVPSSYPSRPSWPHCRYTAAGVW